MDARRSLRRSLFRWAVAVVVALPLMVLLPSCGFEGVCEDKEPWNPCQKFDELPLTPLTQQSVTPAFEVEGAYIALHGHGSAALDSGDFIKIEQSVEVPRYANKATVLLNGWRVNLTPSGDRSLAGLTTVIGRIRLEGGQLRWNAVGLLRDNDAAEAYTWTYHFTVIAWNDTALNLRVNHGDADVFCKVAPTPPAPPAPVLTDNFYFEGPFDSFNLTTTALSSFTSYLETSDFPTGAPIAILPRGFGCGWCEDHHLLQVAYNLDHSEKFVEYGKQYKKSTVEMPAPLPTPTGSPTPTALADSRFVTWNTYSILKDNKLKRVRSFGEMVSALGGRDVGFVNPPFAILPAEDHGNCDPEPVDPNGLKSDDYVVENVPFEHAIPVLTGWELGRSCNDEKVRSVGIGIMSWSYTKNPAAPAGRLQYRLTSALADKDGKPGHYRNHKITILGLRPTTGRLPVLGPGPVPVRR